MTLILVFTAEMMHANRRIIISNELTHTYMTILEGSRERMKWVPAQLISCMHLHTFI